MVLEVTKNTTSGTIYKLPDGLRLTEMQPRYLGSDTFTTDVACSVSLFTSLKSLMKSAREAGYTSIVIVNRSGNKSKGGEFFTPQVYSL